MDKVTFDKAQTSAINIDINAVVSAGAGSGKTSVLSERFTHLVLDKGYKVDEILTLTFTKKATVEMYGRIYKALKEKKESAVSDFYKANIKTLDSYCSSIAKQGAHFYGISPSFSVDKDAVESRISSMALPFILSHKDNPAIKTLARTQNLDQIAQELFVDPIINYSHIAEPIDFWAALTKQRAKVTKDWTNFCTECLATVQTLKEVLDEYNGNRNTKLISTLESGLKAELPPVPQIDETIFQTTDVTEMVNLVQYLNVLAYPPLRGRVPDEIKETVLQLRKKLEPLVDITNFVYGGKIVENIIPLLEEFQVMANDAKRRNSMLTYADVSSLAIKILTEHPEIRKTEKRNYKSIMIDEFQDNNDMQKKLLFLLAEKEDRMDKSIPEVHELCPDKLFFVGDEKQSIYRFRGADVSVFRGLSEDFKEGNLLLQTNYRSDPALIASFNTIFGGTKYPLDATEGKTGVSIFYADQQQDIPKYEPVYINADIPQGKKDDDASGVAPIDYVNRKVHFAFYNKQNDSPDITENTLTDDNAQAAWVVAEIKNLIQNKNVDPSKIAILFRSYKTQPLYEQMLLQQGVPYNTETVTGFFTSAVVSDIFSFLRICAYQDDMIAFEKVLLSAIVNLTLEESNAILSQSCSAFELDASDILDQSSLARYNHAKQLFEKISLEAKEEKLTKIINELWYDAGYRYETLWNKRSTMYATLYDRIFELARQADQNSSSLADFVDSVITYEDEKEHLDDMDIPMEQNAGVHLMTIHKSKGLQFEYVFVTNVNRGSSKDLNNSICFFSKDYGPTINTPPVQSISGKTNYFWNLVKDENQNMALAELKRLTYVAITRAEKEVYITGTIGGRKNSDSILHLLDPLIEYFGNEDTQSVPPFDIIEIPPMEKTETSDFIAGKQAVISRLEQDFANAVVLEKEVEPKRYMNPSKLYAEQEESHHTADSTSTAFMEIDQIISEAKKTETQFTYADFGTIAHSFMEAAILGCEPKILNKNLLGLEGNKKNLEKIMDACRKMQKEFLNTKTGKEASGSQWHKTEYSFRSAVAGKIISGQIDLVYETSDGEYTIVDYKTNHQIEPEIYYNQLACYRQALSQMRNVPSEKIRCILYYLRHGKEVDITEDCSKVDIEKAVQETDE